MSLIKTFEKQLANETALHLAYFGYMENPTEKSLKRLNEQLLETGTSVNNMRNEVIMIQESMPWEE